MTATMTAAPARKPRPSKAAVPVLSLRIGGMAYALARVDPGEGGIIAWRLSKAGEDAPYDVRLAADGSASCTCADFVWRHDGNGSTCKHINDVMVVGLMAGPTPAAEAPRSGERADSGDAPTPAAEVLPEPAPIVTSNAWEFARSITRRWGIANGNQRAAALLILDGHKSHWESVAAPLDVELVASPLPAREPTVAVTATVAEEGMGMTPITSGPLDSAEPCCDPAEALPCAACAHPAPVASYLGVGVVEAPEPVEVWDLPEGDGFGVELVEAVEAHGGTIAEAGPDDALPLILAIRRDAAAYRARGSSLALLYAEALDRLADLASAVEASRAEDVFDRADALDALRWNEALGRQYDLGRRAALAAG